MGAACPPQLAAAWWVLISCCCSFPTRTAAMDFSIRLSDLAAGGGRRGEGGDAFFGLDDIIAINLERKANRRRALSAAAKVHGFKYNIFNATDKCDLDQMEQLRAGAWDPVTGRDNSRDMSTAQVANWHSHSSVWRLIADRGYEAALVLEDDMVVLDGRMLAMLPMLLQMTKLQGTEWDLFFLGYMMEWDMNDIYAGFYRRTCITPRDCAHSCIAEVDMCARSDPRPRDNGGGGGDWGGGRWGRGGGGRGRGLRGVGDGWGGRGGGRGGRGGNGGEPGGGRPRKKRPRPGLLDCSSRSMMEREAVVPKVFRSQGNFGLHAYIISARGARKLLEYGTGPGMPNQSTDRITKALVESGKLVALATDPVIITQQSELGRPAAPWPQQMPRQIWKHREAYKQVHGGVAGDMYLGKSDGSSIKGQMGRMEEKNRLKEGQRMDPECLAS